jgi:serine-type D-Ala-D-Ala carboxypeptidase/endopeptidase (penicillin-binding protein 4)
MRGLAAGYVVCQTLVWLFLAPGPAAADTLQARVEAIARQTPMNRAQLGVLAIDAATGRVLVSHQADREFTPASTFKLLLSVTALETLGPQFRFRTQLLARGTLNGDRLDGDLILVGGGDPTLTSADLSSAAAAVARAGIRQVSGTVLADESLFEGRRWGPDWPWDGLPFYYAAPIQALAIDKALIDVVVTPGSHDGDRISAVLASPSPDYTVSSIAVMAADPDDDPERCSHRLGSTRILIVGRMPLGAAQETLHCAVEDSGARAATVLVQALSAAGVTTGSAPRGSRPANDDLDVIDQGPAQPPIAKRYPNARTLWSQDSQRLIDLYHEMLAKSDNFTAEHILKMLAVTKLHQRGSFIGGATVEQRFAVGLGIDRDALDVQDGSGLCAADRITPRGLVTILRHAAARPYGNDFINALPRAGVEGTLIGRLTGSDAIGRVRAKDGYMQHTIAIAGYADTLHHGRVIFAVMVDEATGPAGPYFDLEDQVVEALADL